MKTKIIRICPKCASEDIGYVMDIFQRPTSKKYYTGECECAKCKHKFNRKDIIKKKWVAVDDILNFIKKYECSLGDLPNELKELKDTLSKTNHNEGKNQSSD